MGEAVPEGHVGALTPLELRKLQKFWARLTEITGTRLPEESNGSIRSGAASSKDGTDTSGQSDAFRHYVATESPETIRRNLWNCVKSDNPDSMVLRFLRARKWDVDKAIDMLVTMTEWRDLQNIDSVVIKGGEAVGLKEKRSEDEEGVMLQYRSGKSFVRGLDKNKRPVYIVRPRLHNPKAQSDRAMELYILHTIESIRMLIKDPYDTTCLIFDLTGFGLRNMDFPAVKFLVQVFEARYPETLGVVLIHNAPWVFQGIWRIIRGWLDPVVASKINFTYKAADLEQFIHSANLMSEYGGADTYTYRYIEPAAGENDPMHDTARIAQLNKEREDIIAQFEKVTVEWAVMGDDVDSKVGQEKYKQRMELADKLAENYWLLDPHVRSRNIYDRLGILSRTGEVNFAPEISEKVT